MTTSVYKLEKDLCRCCHAEGSFRSLAEPVYNLGHQAVYSDMLKTCLNIELCPMPGDLSSMTYTICEACVLRLRDAHNFKQQVELCELRFKEMYKNIVVDTIIDVGVVKEEESGTLNKGVKMETIEVDIVEEDDDGFDVRFNDSDDEQPIIKVKVEESVKHKPRSKQTKPRTKTKKAPPKRSRLPSDSGMAPEDRDKDDNDTETKKRGIWTAYTVVHGENGPLYSCNACGKKFTYRQYYAQHYKHVHLRLRPKEYQCRLCDEKFTNSNRAWHMEVAHDMPAPKCNICDRKFSHPFLLVGHQRAEHLGEKNYTCKLCGHAFATAMRVKRHMARHNDDRPFECAHCNKAFKYRRNWKFHMQKHGKTCVCPICNENFYKQDDLKYHVQVAHPELC